jgi:hypothetical protein
MLFSLWPEIAYAAIGTIPLVDQIKRVILNPLISLLFGAALLYFLWGLAAVVGGGDNETKRTTGREHMLWGIVGMFIMVTVYGLLNLISGTITQLIG